MALVDRRGDRKCWTCAASFTSIEKLNKHLNSRGHRRYGIIPRFFADNLRHSQMHQKGLMRSLQKFPYHNFNNTFFGNGGKSKVASRYTRHAIGYAPGQVFLSAEAVKEEEDKSEEIVSWG